ncbi:MAG TPA: hypothetical protein DCQ30_16590 [Acidimicrobiaceae bacterium]|nr:hypothetical protein [Acidimicrobiaceae bacterium]
MSGPGDDRVLRFGDNHAPRATVVVTAWKGAPHLFACLASLHDTAPAVPFELFVSANEPTAELCAQLDRLLAGATVMSSPLNLGFAGAVNRAAARAAGEFIVLLNDDAAVEPGWLEALVAAADADPVAGAVGGRILSPDGAPREDGTVLWSDGSVTLLDTYYRPVPEPPPGPRRVDHCSAVSLLVRRSVWEHVGGFDEGYFPAYYEDVDLALKIHAMGRTVLYQPASTVRHRQGASASPRYRHFLLRQNRARLRARWSGVLSERPRPDPHNPAALSSAVRRAHDRAPAVSLGPAVADETPPPAPDDERWYLAKQRDVNDAYARSLEAELDARERAVTHRLGWWVRTPVKRALRRVPWAYRALARRRRRPETTPRVG